MLAVFLLCYVEMWHTMLTVWTVQNARVECIRILYTLHEIVSSGVGREGKVVKIVTAEIKIFRI